MAVDQHSEAWLEYRAAIERLYGASIEQIVSGDRAGFESNPSDEAVEDALRASIRLNDWLVNDIQSGSQERSEAGILRLLAAATIDLSIANDLVPFDEPDDPETWGGPVLAETLPDVLEVLEPRLGDPFSHRRIAGGAELDAAEAAALLRASIDSATQGILGDATSTSVSTIAILVGDIAEFLGPALSKLPNEIQQDFTEHSKRMRRVAAFLNSGVQKVLATLGSKRDDVREAVGEWIDKRVDDFETGLIESWLARRYGIAELRSNLDRMVATSGNSPLELVAAADRLDLLAARFHTQMRFARHVAWLVARARKWLMHVATPWSQIVVVSGSAIATGAVICIGQDYLDGPSTFVPRLELVEGVEPILTRSL